LTIPKQSDDSMAFGPIFEDMADSPPASTGELAQQLSDTNAAVGDAAQAVEKAAQTAGEIQGHIQSLDSKAPAPAGQAPASSVPASPPAPPPSPVTAELAQALAVESAPPQPPLVRTALSPELQRLLDIEVPVIVQLGVRQMAVAEVTRFSVGAIIEFHKGAEEELELLANNKLIGKGMTVKVGENFGLKITTIGSVKETIRKLGEQNP
jgi:flagellar motor switch protein FliN/FliY